VARMKYFTTNMALKDCFKKGKKFSDFESNELSKNTQNKLKLIEKAFR
jgi:hypothetical protein